MADDSGADGFGEEAREKIKDMEENPPKDLKDWPDGKAKYVTMGGSEGDKNWDEGPTSKLGPSGVEYQEDGTVTVDGEEVDNPDDFKGDPIPLASDIEPNEPAEGTDDK